MNSLEIRSGIQAKVGSLVETDVICATLITPPQPRVKQKSCATAKGFEKVTRPRGGDDRGLSPPLHGGGDGMV
jgi:hypothetical protein